MINTKSMTEADKALHRIQRRRARQIENNLKRKRQRHAEKQKLMPINTNLLPEEIEYFNHKIKREKSNF